MRAACAVDVDHVDGWDREASPETFRQLLPRFPKDPRRFSPSLGVLDIGKLSTW